MTKLDEEISHEESDDQGSVKCIRIRPYSNSTEKQKAFHTAFLEHALKIYRTRNSKEFISNKGVILHSIPSIDFINRGSRSP